MPVRRRSTAPTRALPFREADRVDTPLSLYAATKRADELMSHAYAHLHGLPQTGLRFFTVYGPWGRPDMAYYSFARAIVAGEPITLYDGGTLRRDFTYIDDIVAGVVGCLDRPPEGAVAGPGAEHRQPPQRAGQHAGARCWSRRWAGRRLCARRRGRRRMWRRRSPRSTRSRALTGFAPRTSLAEGIPRFVTWFTAWHGARRINLRTGALTVRARGAYIALPLRRASGFASCLRRSG